MKKTLLIVLLLIVGCSKEPINVEQMLVERGDVYYTKDTNEPYSGPGFSLWENGQKSHEGTFKDGNQDRKWTYWYENGEKWKEGTYKDGALDGSFKEYYENGRVEKITYYNNGKIEGNIYEFSIDGDTTVLYNKSELNYNNNIVYHNNSKIPFTGIEFVLYETGEKKYEWYYKNGLFVSSKVFHKNGEVNEGGLSDYSAKLVKSGLGALLRIKVYFSDDLPDEYANNRRYLQDILEEYVAFSNGNIRFEFFRPEDDQNIEQEAQKAGIMPVQMQVVENDKLEVKRVLMGMVILYEDKKEVFPVIQTTTGLEYEITTRIKKLVGTNKPIVGIAQIEGQDGQSQNIQNVLKERYNVRSVSLADEVPLDVSVILMSGIADSLTSDENANLKGYLNRGGNLFLAQNRVKTNLQLQQAVIIQSDIFSLIEPFGLQINENLIMDRICGRVEVQQQMGPIRMNVPMEYPLLPIVRKFNTDEVIVAGLEQIQLVFASEIQSDSSAYPEIVIEAETGIVTRKAGPVNFVPLLFTSEQSGEMRGNFNLSPDPQQNPFLRLFYQSGFKPIKILGARSERVDENGIISQVVLVGDSDFFLDEGGGRSVENHIFVMNSVDYLIGNRDLIALRYREITSRPLEEVSMEWVKD